MCEKNMEFFMAPVKFELKETLCFGVQRKWGKINIPLRMENTTELETLAQEKGCKNPIHGRDILYLKCDGLSPMQKADLLDMGRCFVNVKSECIGVYAKKEEKYLVLKVKKLSRAQKEVEIEVPEDY